MGLPHRYPQSRRPTAVQLAKPRIAIPVGTALDVLIPQHRQGDVLALELAVDLAPIGLEVAAMTLFGADGRKQRRLQRGISHLRRQWPAQPRARQPYQRQPDRRRRNPYPPGNLIEPDPGGSQTKHFAHAAHWHPLCWHPLPRAKAKGADPNRASGGVAYPSEIIREWWAKSSRNAERHQIGLMGDIIADSRATSPGIRKCLFYLLNDYCKS
jgi:hypothetical protein